MGNSPSKEFGCTICLKVFRTDWMLKHHMNHSHKDEKKYNKECVDGEYPCRMCAETFANKIKLKDHVFKDHCEIDVKVSYGI
jgi:hypothetical protein